MCKFTDLICVVPHVRRVTYERVHVCVCVCKCSSSSTVSKCSVLRVCVCVQDLWTDGGGERFCGRQGEGVGARSCKCGRLCVSGGGEAGGRRGVLDVACCRHKGGLMVNTHSGSSGSAAGSPANKPFIKAV